MILATSLTFGDSLKINSDSSHTPEVQPSFTHTHNSRAHMHMHILLSLGRLYASVTTMGDRTTSRHRQLSCGLKYAFLIPSYTFPIVIAYELNMEQEDEFIMLVKKYKAAIGWTMVDIKGINPLICTHKNNLVSFGIVVGHIVLIIVSYYFIFLFLWNLHVCRKLTLEAPLKSFGCSLNLFLACLFAFLQNIEVNVRFRLGGGIVISWMLVVFPSFFHCVFSKQQQQQQQQQPKKKKKKQKNGFIWELHVFVALLLTWEWDLCLSHRFYFMSLLKQNKNTLFWSQEPYEVLGW